LSDGGNLDDPAIPRNCEYKVTVILKEQKLPEASETQKLYITCFKEAK